MVNPRQKTPDPRGLKAPITKRFPISRRARCGFDAVISPRRNAQSWKETTAGAAARSEALRASRRLDAERDRGQDAQTSAVRATMSGRGLSELLNSNLDTYQLMNFPIPRYTKLYLAPDMI